MKIGFIGFGNMATAIIKGLVTSHTVKTDDIGTYDVISTAKMKAEEYGFKFFDNAGELISACDTVVLSVKPKDLEKLLKNNSGAFSGKNPLIITIAAGKEISFYESFLEYKPSLVRVMPNINALVQSSMSAYCDNGNVSEQQEDFVKLFLTAIGSYIKLPENMFSLFSAVASCSPAYTYLYIDSLARAAVKNGMKKDDALKIATGAVLGSSKMIEQSGEHPWELIDKVCSPGGTTIEGLLSLQNDGFESTVERAIQAAVEKDKNM